MARNIFDWQPEACKRRCRSGPEPAGATDHGIGQKIQHHPIMIAHQAGDVVGQFGCQLMKPL